MYVYWYRFVGENPSRPNFPGLSTLHSGGRGTQMFGPRSGLRTAFSLITMTPFVEPLEVHRYPNLDGLKTDLMYLVYAHGLRVRRAISTITTTIAQGMT